MQNRVSFGVGDIVHLKSGSPDLKVISIENGEAEVEYLDDENVTKTWRFPAIGFQRVA